MKLAITGKGGVGKTTLTALLAYLFATDGRRVLAVDADPDANLGNALGVREDELAKIVPIKDMEDLIYERTGARPGTMGGWFALNPKVDDIPENCALQVRENIKLLVMGGITSGGGGCACPENALLRELLRHLVVDRDETVLVDMEAGLEHVGRGTARSVDAFVVVIEPGRRSFQTAHAIVRLARDLGVKRVLAVANKVREDQVEAVRQGVGDLEFLGYLPYDPCAVHADLGGEAAFTACPALLNAARGIKDRLEKALL